MLLRTLAFLLIGLLTSAHAVAEPAFFTDKPYGEAKQTAADSEKLLFVKATAVWCGPCKMMDRTTFKDQRVIDWLTNRAISVSVDVDDEPQVAGRLKIRAMPTTILMRGDEELARIVGYRDADDLLTWLDRAADGKVAKAADRPEPDPEDIDARLDRARELARDHEFREATDEYVWLWNNMLKHQPSMRGVRVSFMAGDMSSLAKMNAGAKAAFTKLRDATEDRLVDGAGKKKWDDLRDWLVLNERVLHDREPIRKWIDRIKDRPTAKTTFSRVDDIIDQVLIDDGRWALLGSLIENPLQDIEMHKMLAAIDRDNGDFDEEMRAEIERSERRRFANNVSTTIAALLAAERDKEAERVLDEALALQDDTMMRATIVSRSMKAGQARSWHLDLIDGVVADDAEKVAPMRAAVEAALRG